jgi:molybdopterin molybdotransferase
MNRSGTNTFTPGEALRIILESSARIDGIEDASIFDSAGRILGEDIISDINIPPLDNSAMDGYAVISSDTRGASNTNPAVLPVIAEIQAGGSYDKIYVNAKTAVRIMTGAPIPAGADSVIQFEDTREDNKSVYIFREVMKGENIRLAGEDIPKGKKMLTAGRRLNSADAGLIASLNRKSVKVRPRPRIAIISTGDEIADIGETSAEGIIRNSNAYVLYTEIKKYAIPHIIGIARDNLKDTVDMLRAGLDHDVMITTGGVSMGKYDFVKEAASELGIGIMVENILMKPGKPCVFGMKGSKLFFGLPGNPVSTLVSFIQFVRPAILTLMGASKTSKPEVLAILDDDISKKPGRMHFVRGYYSIINGNIHVATTGPQGSGILRSMSEANCLILVPSDTEHVKAGEKVMIQLIHHEEI